MLRTIYSVAFQSCTLTANIFSAFDALASHLANWFLLATNVADILRFVYDWTLRIHFDNQDIVSASNLIILVGNRFICQFGYLVSIAGLHMSDERLKKHTGKCFDCDGLLELVEFDVKKGTRIMKCKECGLYHFQKRELFGGWKLLKVSKKPSIE